MLGEDTNPNDDSVFSKEDIRVLQAFNRSKTWRVLRDALCFRREQLFNEEESTTEQMWKNRGRILEIQWLLNNAGKLMLQYEAWRRAEAKTSPSPGEDATFDAGTSKVPSGPATFTS